MKIFKTAILGMVFLFGISAMPNAENSKTNASEDAIKKVPCSTVFTVCDNNHPEDYDLFMICMDRNECGG